VTARLFVALELPGRVRARLPKWCGDALSGERGMRVLGPESLHVTLCFLGSRRVEEIDAIGAALASVAGEPVAPLSIGEPVWLPPRRPRVLAVELSDHDGLLAAVQDKLAAVLSAGGWYAREARPFLAHVTVARVARDARVRPVDLPAPPPARFDGSVVTLFRSQLGPGGARYEALSRVELGSGAAPTDPVSVVRRFHAEQARAYAGEGTDGVRSLLADDVIWHVPGASAIAGEHRGVDAVLAYLEKRRAMTDSTFRVTVHGAELIAGRVVQLAGGRAVRAGRELTWETLGVFRVADGQIAECWLVPFDAAAFDEIWR
jgi:2'-5' RNA ligase